MFNNLKQRILVLYEKYEVRFNVLFFVGGFIFDALLVSEIDDLLSLIQQVAYLVILALFIHNEILFRLHKWRPRPQGYIEKIWDYRALLMHFLLGSLLNVYSLFYIKSASLISSIIFLSLMAALVIANELPVIKKANVGFKVALFSICLFSFISLLFPILLGFVGWTPFGLSVASTLAIFYFQLHLLKQKITETKILFQALMLPSVSVVMIFGLFYFLGWIPPVPLSVKEQGIYHLVEKKDGHYYLHTEKPKWKFWQSGDQDFQARPHDIIYFYSQIYSPARFSDQIYIQWLYRDSVKGWQKTDRILLQILGGRKEGFRGFTSKTNYQPGEWRVQVETAIGHEISRLNFEVTAAASEEPRNFNIIIK